MEDEVVVTKQLRFGALDEVEDNLLGEGVVFDTELLRPTQVGLEALHLLGRTAHLNRISTSDHTHLRVHVFEAEDILIIDPVKRTGVEVIG